MSTFETVLSLLLLVVAVEYFTKDIRDDTNIGMFLILSSTVIQIVAIVTATIKIFTDIL